MRVLREQRGAAEQAARTRRWLGEGDRSDVGREEVKRIAATLGGEASGLNVTALMQDVLLGRLGLPRTVSAPKAKEHRSLRTSWPFAWATRTACSRWRSSGFWPA